MADEQRYMARAAFALRATQATMRRALAGTAGTVQMLALSTNARSQNPTCGSCCQGTVPSYHITLAVPCSSSADRPAAAVPDLQAEEVVINGISIGGAHAPPASTPSSSSWTTFVSLSSMCCCTSEVKMSLMHTRSGTCCAREAPCCTSATA